MVQKSIIFVSSVICILLFSCNPVKLAEKPIPNEEMEQIKIEVIASITNHIEVLKTLDYKKAMKFYHDENYIVFGDGKYWGDYSTIDDIWKSYLPKWRAIKKWDLKTQKVHVFSRSSAIAYVEWDHARIEENGNETRAYGFWVFGMQKFQDGWKSVNFAIDHRYIEDQDD